MRDSILCASFVLVSFLCVGAASAAPQEPQATQQVAAGVSSSISAADLNTRLDHLSEELDADPAAALRNLPASLPQAWQISSPEGNYSISTAPLRSYLAHQSLQQAREWIATLQVELDTSAATVNASSTAHAELNRILATSEFAGVRPPSALALLGQRISAWINRMVGNLFSRLARHPLGIKMFFWTLLACAVAFVAFVIYRFVSRGDDLNAFQPQSSMVTARSWQEWLRSARQAAERGDFSEAVHATYWAAIARLEDIDVLPRDRSKTPREYLKLAREWDSSGARREDRGEVQPNQPFAPPLTRLTNTFERNWYARHTASQQDFQDSLRQLETIGCPLE